MVLWAFFVILQVDMDFELTSKYKPTGDKPEAINQLYVKPRLEIEVW